MKTHILTQSQQKKCLSAKKGPIKGLKNVLAQSQKNYWPVLKNENEPDLENILESLLPTIKRSQEKIPWSQLRKMTKEERITARKEIKNKPNPDFNEKAAKDIVFGVNSVTRLLEKNSICCVLLDASVDPSILIKHVVFMAQTRNIPVLLVTFLKKITLKTIGFSSAAIGLKKNVSESLDNYLHSLFEKVSKLSLELPKPRDPVALVQNSMMDDDKLDKGQENIIKLEKIKEEIVEPVAVSTDIYLYRSSKKERIFKPLGSSTKKQSTQKLWGDYIKLGDSDVKIDTKKLPSRFFEHPAFMTKELNNKNMNAKNKKDEQKVKKKNKEQINKSKVSYKPLKVKRLQGNNNRIKATKHPKKRK